jgi:hypothetical protein
MIEVAGAYLNLFQVTAVRFIDRPLDVAVSVRMSDGAEYIEEFTDRDSAVEFCDDILEALDALTWGDDV